MKVIRVTVEDEEGKRIHNAFVHVAEVSDLQKFVDNLEIVALGIQNLVQRVQALESENRKLR